MLTRKLLQKGIAVALLAVISACSGSSESETAPQANRPGNPPGGEFQPTNPGVDNRFPAMLATSVDFELSEPLNNTGLREIAADFSPDRVGPPRISFSLRTEANNKVSGDILFSFEDRIGFWGAILPSFGTTSSLSSNGFDFIFADDELVFRAVGTRSASQLDGQLFYRVRATGENQCKPVYVYCNVSYPSNTEFSNWWLYPAPEYPAECNTRPNVDGPCLSYMSTSQAQVKSMGWFEGSLTQWLR